MPAETWAHEPAWWTVKYGPTVEALIQATWREIASVGALVAWQDVDQAATDRANQLDRMYHYALDVCGCEEGKACHEHRMWQAGEEPWR